MNNTNVNSAAKPLVDSIIEAQPDLDQRAVAIAVASAFGKMESAVLIDQISESFKQVGGNFSLPGLNAVKVTASLYQDLKDAGVHQTIIDEIAHPTFMTIQKSMRRAENKVQNRAA